MTATLINIPFMARPAPDSMRSGSPDRAGTRTNPSWQVLATRRPSRAKMLPRAKARAPEALGLSVEYKSQSSTRIRR